MSKLKILNFQYNLTKKLSRKPLKSGSAKDRELRPDADLPARHRRDEDGFPEDRPEQGRQDLLGRAQGPAGVPGEEGRRRGGRGDGEGRRPEQGRLHRLPGVHGRAQEGGHDRGHQERLLGVRPERGWADQRGGGDGDAVEARGGVQPGGLPEDGEAGGQERRRAGRHGRVHGYDDLHNEASLMATIASYIAEFFYIFSCYQVIAEK
ncbi:calmodulin-like protein 1 [Iris pallida]|uniref:Calmodulin-like protein 1 n=1 Tax=Iris pallida TaxID=29817 RepID=A0AAX6HGJ6_IRIPA|nr:calmodulin-like protein 1 [Iris pallida]